MDETKIEVSKEGITFPYRRYLSDSASGFVLILLFFMLLENTPSIQNFLGEDFPGEVRVFVLILLFLLSTPIGVVVNVISWMAFEKWQKNIEEFFLDYLFGSFKKEYKLSESMEALSIKKENWFPEVRTVEATLMDRHSVFVDKIESLRGIAILVRNLSLIALVLGGCLIFLNYGLIAVVLCFVLFLLFLILSAAVSFYFHVQIIFWGYTTFLSESRKKAPFLK